MIPLMVLAGLLCFVGSMLFLWLCVIAFKESVVWGLVALFVPFGNVVFAVKHWEVSKKPFLSGLACTVLGVVMMFGAFAVGAAQLQQQVMNDPDFQKALAEMGEMEFEGGEAAAEPVVETAVPAAAAVPVQAPRRPDVPMDSVDSPPISDPPAMSRASKRRGADRDAIRFDQASEFIGEIVHVVGKDGVDVVATLEASRDGKLVFARNFMGGDITFEMAEGEIASLKVVRR